MFRSRFAGATLCAGVVCAIAGTALTFQDYLNAAGGSVLERAAFGLIGVGLISVGGSTRKLDSGD
ncbi:MAG: hypothetical protein R2729_15485 [Bryobacteraceae bacterium]